MPMDKIPGDGFEVEVIRSRRRKTLALSVADGKVTVRMPARLAVSYAERFVHKKSHWIKAKLAQNPPFRERLYQDGEILPFLGDRLRLDIDSGRGRNAVRVDGEKISVTTRLKTPSQTALKKQLTDWYRQQATEYLHQRVEDLAGYTALKPTYLEVKTYRARWGSCTLSGKIQLNWKLIMAPPTIIDYVILHELCHLRQHNHSPAFWRLVARFDPNFTTHRAWLKQNGQQLEL